MSLPRTSKDLNSCPSFFFFLALPQNLDKNQNLDKEINSNLNKEFLPKNSSQKIPPEKILLKKSSQKILKKISKQKKSKKNLKNPNNFQTISQKIPIPYIALRGRKPFRACLCKYPVPVQGWYKV